MKSLEKIEQFKTALLRVDEPLDGPFGAFQAMASLEKMGMETPFGAMLPETSEELDELALDLAAFSLWLRSDDAPTPTLEELMEPPAVIAGLLA